MCASIIYWIKAAWWYNLAKIWNSSRIMIAICKTCSTSGQTPHPSSLTFSNDWTDLPKIKESATYFLSYTQWRPCKWNKAYLKVASNNWLTFWELKLLDCSPWPHFPNSSKSHLSYATPLSRRCNTKSNLNLKQPRCYDKSLTKTPGTNFLAL